MLKESIHWEVTTIINRHTPKIGASKDLKQMFKKLKRKIDNNTVIVGDFNTLLSIMDSSSRQTIYKETVD